VGIWVIVCIEEPSHHFLQTFRHYECLRLCSAIVRFIRNNCLYFCLLWLISASAGYITNFCSMIGLLHELKNSSCQHRSIQAGPQPEGGKLPDRPPEIFKNDVFVRYSNKLHHFAPPENISWLRPCIQAFGVSAGKKKNYVCWTSIHNKQSKVFLRALYAFSILV